VIVVAPGSPYRLTNPNRDGAVVLGAWLSLPLSSADSPEALAELPAHGIATRRIASVPTPSTGSLRVELGSVMLMPGGMVDVHQDAGLIVICGQQGGLRCTAWEPAEDSSIHTRTELMIGNQGPIAPAIVVHTDGRGRVLNVGSDAADLWVLSVTGRQG
jgi:hypothetical protein